MNRCTILATTLGIFFGAISADAQTNYYWDINGSNAGFFTPGGYADGAWDGTAANWNPNAAGTDPTEPWNDGASPANNAIFQVAGAGAAGDVDALVSVGTGTRPVTGMKVEGWVALSGSGGLNVGTGGLTIEQNSKLTLHAIPTGDPSPFSQYPGVTESIPSYTGVVAMGAHQVTIKQGGVLGIEAISQLSFTAGSGGVILDGGKISSRQATLGNPSFSGNMSLTIAANTGVGSIEIPSVAQTAAIWTPVIASGVGIFGEGGTLLNGGRGTLVKTGSGELRMGAAGNFTFANLEVRGRGITNDTLTGETTNAVTTGMYGVNTISSENVFGAVPLSLVLDRIKLTDGGQLRSGASFGLHPNRGIEIGSGGGGSWNAGGGVLQINGPISGSGTYLSSGNSVGGGGMAWNNPSNTWQGDIVMRTGQLWLNESLTANNLSGDIFSTAVAQILVAPGKSFTFGTSENTEFQGRLSGPSGTINKVGTGELNMATGTAGNEWTNLGTVNINAGGLKFGTGNAGFGDWTKVNIASGAYLDMNGIGDAFGGLEGAGEVRNHNKDPLATGANLNLRGADNYAFSGTIAGVGKVVKNGLGTQTLTGNNTYTGGTDVTAGILRVNNDGSASGIGSGPVTIAGSTTLAGAGILDGTATLGGSGRIDGDITVNANGHLQAGVGLGNSSTLTANGSVTVNSGGHLDFVVGNGAADRLIVNPALGLTLNSGGVFTVAGAAGGVTPGTYSVLSYHTSGYNGSIGSMHLNNATGYELVGGVDDSTPGEFRVTVTSTVQNRTWSGGSGDWSYDASTNANWGGVSQPNGPGAVANFGPTGAATVTISDSNKSVGTLNLDEAGGYTIAASGAHRLVTDAYSGDAVINLTSGNHTISAPLTTKKNTVVNTNGNTLTVSGGLLNNAGLANAGTGTLEITNSGATNPIINHAAIENSGAGTLNIKPGGTGSFVNNGDGSVVNSGSGNLMIQVNGAAAGNINFLNNGAVINSGSGNLSVVNIGAGTTPTASSVNLSDNLTVGAGVGGSFRNTGTGTMTISSNVFVNAGMTFANDNAADSSMVVSGVLSGTFGNGASYIEQASVTIEGSQTVVFAGVNTYARRTILKSGKLQISADNNLGAAPSVEGGFYDNLLFDGGTLRTAQSAAFSINANRGMYIKSTGGIENGGTGTVTYAGRVLAEGNFAKSGSAAVTLSGVYHLNANDLRIDSNGGTLTLSGNVLGDGNRNLTLGGSNTITASGTINLGTGTLTKDGSGTLTLSGGSNVIGTVNHSGGRININNDNATGTAAINVGAGPGIVLGNTAAGITYANNIALSADPTNRVEIASSQSITQTGVISGNRGLIRTDSGGSGTFVLAGNNTFTGGIVLQGRSLVLGNKNAVGTGTLSLGDAATPAANLPNLRSSIPSGVGELTGANAVANAVVVNRNFRFQGGNPLELSGNVTLNSLDGTNTTRQIGSNGSGTIGILSGVISGNGVPIEKTEAAQLVLKGANTYDGGTIVTAGTLTVDGINATLGTGNVSVGTGGILEIVSGVSNAIANTALVTIAGGNPGVSGFMNVGAGINEVIAGLTLGTNVMAAGTYGSTASGATFQSDEFFAPGSTGILTVSGIAGVPGDYNSDSIVDARDYVLWRKSPAEHGGNPGGYDTWKGNFGAGTGPAASSGSSLVANAAVPEPASVVLVLMGFAVVGFRRRSR